MAERLESCGMVEETGSLVRWVSVLGGVTVRHDLALSCFYCSSSGLRRSRIASSCTTEDTAHRSCIPLVSPC